MKIYSDEKKFEIRSGDKAVISHSESAPAFFIGRGEHQIKMHCGNFDIKDDVSLRLPLGAFKAESIENGLNIDFFDAESCAVCSLRVTEERGRVTLSAVCGDSSLNRFWIRFNALPDERVFGGGEQFSALDLRGRKWPIWTREQGVGRNKSTRITQLADELDGSGGDYHTTFFPAPTFVSSRMYFAHLGNYEYSELDFINKEFHEVYVWSSSVTLTLDDGESYPQLIGRLAEFFGRLPQLPQWAVRGIWLGMQGGTELCESRLRNMLALGTDVTAVWIQDWEGKRVTSFGKRLQWDWRWNKELYPELDRVIRESAEKGIGWMGYINPYLVEDGVLFKEAAEQGFLVKKAGGGILVNDYGEFNCGIVDLTREDAFEWYKNIVKKNLIGMGFCGWMADFGEYLPTECEFAGGEDPVAMHNKWPMLWAKLNYEAIAETGNLGKVVFFSRSGAPGSQRYSLLLWAGDQCVDWSEDDGLPSVITAALSAGMTGSGLHTCDIGGYTTLFDLKRTKELYIRWLEFAAFTPVMRTHEGNRPDSNCQFDSDSETADATARWSRIHTALAPYTEECVLECSRDGLPAMRPLFMHYPDEPGSYEKTNYEYLYGRSMLVAPVVAEGAHSRTVFLPNDKWTGLWDGKEYCGGVYEVESPLGAPPVFLRSSFPVDVAEKLRSASV